MLQQIRFARIHRPGSVVLRHMGDACQKLSESQSGSTSLAGMIWALPIQLHTFPDFNGCYLLSLVMITLSACSLVAFPNVS